MSILLLLLSAVGPPIDSERIALDYLARHVPEWPRKHRCYSCHHNGDAARSLYAASRLLPLTQTTLWLGKPAGWDKNGSEGPFNDVRLARLQFSLALTAAYDAKALDDVAARRFAARLLRKEQGRDGAWHVIGDESLGGATTYGNAVATGLARHALVRLEAKESRMSIALADRWLRGFKPTSVLDAAGVLIGLESARDGAAITQRRRCLTLIREGESREGGWGPEVNSPPEVFDTAAVLVAMSRQKPSTEIRAWMRRGRTYLRETQNADGSWIETTRPSGAVSYSQRLSTSGWATMALLRTRD